MRSLALALGCAMLSCGDRSPPALWPEPPPPVLAVPIGIADPDAVQTEANSQADDDAPTPVAVDATEDTDDAATAQSDVPVVKDARRGNAAEDPGRKPR